MSAFHVYVEAPLDPSPGGVDRLALAISKKYGLPAPDLVKRMTAGRFRVKSNVDAATADTYARALEELGARVKVEEAHPTQPGAPVAPASRSAPVPAAAPAPGAKTRSGRYSESPPLSLSRTEVAGPRPSTPPARPPASTLPPAAENDWLGDFSLPPTSEVPASSSSLPAAPSPPPPNASRPATSSLPPASASRPATSSLPPASASRPATSALPPANAPASNPGFQSGLSAAFSQSPVESDLGAIGDDSLSLSLSLSSLDGHDALPAGGSFDMAPPPMPASMGPPPEEPPAVKFSPRPATEPAAAGAKPATAKPASAKPADVPLDLFAPPDAGEAEQVVSLAVERAAAPPPSKVETPPLGTPELRKTPVSQPVATGGVAVAGLPRARFAAGVLLAIVVGFLPAHLIASMRESSAFEKIDDQIIATQTAADTPELYETLDSFRDAQLVRKESKRRSLALQSLLIWAVAAAGLGYVWFRRIPWDRTARA